MTAESGIGTVAFILPAVGHKTIFNFFQIGHREIYYRLHYSRRDGGVKPVM
jgi:hypothetical protein